MKIVIDTTHRDAEVHVEMEVGGQRIEEAATRVNTYLDALRKDRKGDSEPDIEF